MKYRIHIQFNYMDEPYYDIEQSTDKDGNRWLLEPIFGSFFNLKGAQDFATNLGIDILYVI